MNKKEIAARVSDLLASGVAKADVFAQLAGRGLKDSRLAYMIAACPDAGRCYEHNRKVNVLITLMGILALLAFVIGFGIGATLGPTAKWVFGIVLALIPLAFAWGFYLQKVGAYNAYILLTIVQLPKSFDGFTASPVVTSVGIALNLGLLAYVWYVRDKLFPGFLLMGPKKIKGQYVFEG